MGCSVTNNLPAKKEDQPKSLWPTEYWPEGKEGYTWTNDKLVCIVQEIADTNDSQKNICQRHGMNPATFTRLRNQLPDFDLAVQLAKAARNDRLTDEMLEIADEPLSGNDELDGLDLRHRALKIQAREKVIKAGRERAKKGMDTFTLNVSSDGDEPATVNIQVVNYAGEG